MPLPLLANPAQTPLVRQWLLAGLPLEPSCHLDHLLDSMAIGVGLRNSRRVVACRLTLIVVWCVIRWIVVCNMKGVSQHTS